MCEVIDKYAKDFSRVRKPVCTVPPSNGCLSGGQGGWAAGGRAGLQDSGNAGEPRPTCSGAVQRAPPHGGVQGFPQIQLFLCPFGQGAFQQVVPMPWCCVQPCSPLPLPGELGSATQAMPALTAVPCPAPAGGERAPGGEPVPAGAPAEEDGVQEPGGAGPAVPPPAAGRHAAPGALLWPGERGLGAVGSRGCAMGRERRLTLLLPFQPTAHEQMGLLDLGGCKANMGGTGWIRDSGDRHPAQRPLMGGTC